MSNQEWYNERIKSNLKTQLKNNTRQDIIKGYVDYFTKSMIAINIADKEMDPSISKYRFIDIEELRKLWTEIRYSMNIRFVLNLVDRY